MTAVTEPLVPAEVDLRDYDYMPLYGKRLFESDTWLHCDDAEKLAALRLWWASWHQEPAGSLPDNDRVLCSLAGKGDVLKAWQAVKDNAMRGWIKCTDGRLYHPVVASIALEVWATKRKKQTENAADRERKRRKPKGAPPESADRSAGIPAENALKGKGEGIGDVAVASAGEPAARNPDPAYALLDEIAEIVSPHAASAPAWMVAMDVRRWLDGGCDPALYILPTVRRMHAERSGKPGYPPKSPAYFTQAIADAKATRLQPMPEGRADGRKAEQAQAPTTPSALETVMARERERARHRVDELPGGNAGAVLSPGPG